jgi:DNA-binding transcriptional LysR family regulator
MDELRAISTFIRATELGSFNKAALAQGTTPQAVSKNVRQLEQHLGVRLFHRTTRKSALTEEGQRLFDSVRVSMDGLTEALSAARSAAKEDEGLIRISAASSVARKVLLPLLAKFSQKYPAMQFDLVLEDRITDAVSERIDIGFRAGNAPTSQIIARRLFPIQLIVCASPDYLASHPTPVQPGDLLQHRCIGYRQPSTGRVFPWEFCVKGEVTFQQVRAAVTCSDPEAEMQAVISGMGIGQIDSINATAPIRAGQLVPLLTRAVSNRMGLHLYYGQRAGMPGRVRRLIDFVSAQLKGSEEFNMPVAELRSRYRSFVLTGDDDT